MTYNSGQYPPILWLIYYQTGGLGFPFTPFNSLGFPISISYVDANTIQIVSLDRLHKINQRRLQCFTVSGDSGVTNRGCFLLPVDVNDFSVKFEHRSSANAALIAFPNAANIARLFGFLYQEEPII